VVRPRSCRVIYYCDTPVLGIRHQLFDHVTNVDEDDDIHIEDCDEGDDYSIDNEKEENSD
jgi:hypothetical protein